MTNIYENVYDLYGLKKDGNPHPHHIVYTGVLIRVYDVIAIHYGLINDD